MGIAENKISVKLYKYSLFPEFKFIMNGQNDFMIHSKLTWLYARAPFGARQARLDRKLTVMPHDCHVANEKR